MSDDLCQQLEHIDLTEEDAEMLLEDALELNKKLKAELKRIEKKQKYSQSNKSGTSPQKVKTPQKFQSQKARAIDQRIQTKELGPKQSPLPPIHSKSGKNASGARSSQSEFVTNSPYASDVRKSKGRKHLQIGASVSNGRVFNSAGSVQGTQHSPSRSLGPVVGARRESYSADSSVSSPSKSTMR